MKTKLTAAYLILAIIFVYPVMAYAQQIKAIKLLPPLTQDSLAKMFIYIVHLRD